MLVVDLGRLSYKEAWKLQLIIHDAKKSGLLNEDVLLFVEHPNVITMGSSGREENLLLSKEELLKKGVEFYKVDRGGDITYHGPGQLVGYPIIDLSRRNKDLLLYVRSLEKSVVEVLAKYNIKASTKKDLTGVWVGNEKICAVGVGARSWITKHGFALNVNVDLDCFSWIIPCGIRGFSVTSMERLLLKKPDFDEVKDSYVKAFSEIFNVQVNSIDTGVFIKTLKTLR